MLELAARQRPAPPPARARQPPGPASDHHEMAGRDAGLRATEGELRALADDGSRRPRGGAGHLASGWGRSLAAGDDGGHGCCGWWRPLRASEGTEADHPRASLSACTASSAACARRRDYHRGRARGGTRRATRYRTRDRVPPRACSPGIGGRRSARGAPLEHRRPGNRPRRAWAEVPASASSPQTTFAAESCDPLDQASENRWFRTPHLRKATVVRRARPLPTAARASARCAAFRARSR